MKRGGVLIKSNNALAAEREGRFPATGISKALRVPAAAVLALAPDDGEWHHCSKFANEIRYFDLEVCREYFGSDVGKAAMATWKAARKAVAVVVHENQTVAWLEWGGTRSHPKADKREVAGCVVTIKGNTATITPPTGKPFQKRVTTRGFSFRPDKVTP
jgi:hypothetical protein